VSECVCVCERERERLVKFFPKKRLNTKEKELCFILQCTIFACIIMVLFLHRNVKLNMIFRFYLKTSSVLYSAELCVV